MIRKLLVDNVLITSSPMDSFPSLNSIQKQSYVHYKIPPILAIIKYFLVFEFAPFYFQMTWKLLVDNILITSNPADSFPSLNSLQKQSYVSYKIPPILTVIKYFLVFEFAPIYFQNNLECIQ